MSIDDAIIAAAVSDQVFLAVESSGARERVGEIPTGVRRHVRR